MHQSVRSYRTTSKVKVTSVVMLYFFTIVDKMVDKMAGPNQCSSNEREEEENFSIVNVIYY